MLTSYVTYVTRDNPFLGSLTQENICKCLVCGVWRIIPIILVVVGCSCCCCCFNHKNDETGLIYDNLNYMFVIVTPMAVVVSPVYVYTQTHMPYVSRVRARANVRAMILCMYA